MEKQILRNPIFFFIQYLKIKAPEVIGADIENEAKWAIQLLVTLLPEISCRYGEL